MKKILVLSLLAISVIFSFTACNYRLAGTAAELPFKSVYVKPVRNASYAPQAGDLLTGQICTQLTRVAQLRIADESDAQAILNVVLCDYTKSVAATSEADTGVGQAFTLRLEAECTLYNKATGEKYFENKKVSKFITVYQSSSGVLGSEYQNMPQLTRELAREIANEVTAIW